MEFHVTSAAPPRQRTGCVIVGVFENGELSEAARQIDAASGGLLRRLGRRGDLPTEPCEVQLINDPPKLRATRLLIVACGSRQKFGRRQYRRSMLAAGRVLERTGASSAVSYVGTESDIGPYYLARIGAEAIGAAVYRSDALKSEPGRRRTPLERFGVGVAERGEQAAAGLGARHGQAIVAGMKLARDLANLPANVCTPTHLARIARQLADAHALQLEVMDEARMKKLGMGALLAVARGTDEPARLIVLRYRGAPNRQPPIAFVGKGITFDSGGISLKPPPNMDEMKFDMSGAATVLGTIKAIAELELPINVVAVLPCCENLPSGHATKPGDIVKSLSGQTIEILNTDAEGRLIMCDALSFARRYKPELMIDVATLTGACVVALGAHFTGLMSNDDSLAEALEQASIRTDDRAWRLPISEEYAEQLKSQFADVANVGGREGGAITAACFLSRFTEGVPWAHLDIAGTAYMAGNQKGSTGRPIPLLVDFLLHRAGIL